MLGVLLLLAFICLGHEHQDLSGLSDGLDYRQGKSQGTRKQTSKESGHWTTDKERVRAPENRQVKSQDFGLQTMRVRTLDYRQ